MKLATIFCTVLTLGATASLGAEAPASQPAEIRRGVEMSGDREQRRRDFYQRIIKKIEPTGRGDASRVPQYLELFKREFVDDTRTFAFDVTGESTAGGIVLRGFVEFPEHQQALAQFFARDDLSRMLEEHGKNSERLVL